MGLCQIFFKALLAGLTNQRDISDSFAVTPLITYSSKRFTDVLISGGTINIISNPVDHDLEQSVIFFLFALAQIYVPNCPSGVAQT